MTQEEKARAYDEAIRHKKVLFTDLDGTLIDTTYGNTFPKGIWDMRFKWDVIQAIKDYGFEILIIVSNQGGIEKELSNSAKVGMSEESKWSDEDEELLQHCCGAVAAADYYTMEDKEEMKNWLISLKQRMEVQQ